LSGQSFSFSASNSIEREKQQLNNERDRLTRTLHTFETQLHQTQLRETQLLNDIRESERLEQQIKEDRFAIEAARVRIKVSGQNSSINFSSAH
jgi:hypothetical protein